MKTISVIGGVVCAGALSMIAGFITHCFWIFAMLMNDTATDGRLLLALFGVLLPPIGCLHGVYLWFNHW